VWSQGDFNYDGGVDFEDLLQLAQHYDMTVGAGAAAGGVGFGAEVVALGAEFVRAVGIVPEPASAVMMAGLMGCVALRRRRV
jgi:hypothetical protein